MLTASKGNRQLTSAGVRSACGDSYKPDWGRYTQSDPVGLAGGVNLYSYALQSPLRNIDPFGLRSCLEQIPDDLQRFREAYNQWFENPRLAAGERPEMGRGPSSNIGWTVGWLTPGEDPGFWGTSCYGWNAGLMFYGNNGSGLSGLDTECCHARLAEYPLHVHTYVIIECRGDTCSDVYFPADIFDAWRRGAGEPHQPLHPSWESGPVTPPVWALPRCQ
jgi:RHS repeat-associated protein